MEQLLVFLTSHSAALIYFFLFAILFLSGLGLPVPEDAVILSGGFLIYFGYTEPLETMLFAFFGVLSGDTLIFTVGQRWGADAVRHKSISHLLTPRRLSKVQAYFQKYGAMTVLMARFLVGLRAPTFLLAGAMYMPFRQFFWLDFAAAVISVPMVTYLGYAFAPQLESLLRMVHRVEFFIIGVLVVVTVAIYFIRRRGDAG